MGQAGHKMNQPGWDNMTRSTINYHFKYIIKYKSPWKVAALYGNNTSTTDNIHEPAPD